MHFFVQYVEWDDIQLYIKQILLTIRRGAKCCLNSEHNKMESIKMNIYQKKLQLGTSIFRKISVFSDSFILN